MRYVFECHISLYFKNYGFRYCTSVLGLHSVSKSPATNLLCDSLLKTNSITCNNYFPSSSSERNLELVAVDQILPIFLFDFL